MSELYRLVYASKNLVSGSEADVTAAVRQILEASRRNNAKVDVTGALMFNAGAFAQVLEGPRRGVEETFERIQCDPRHGDVTVLQCGPAQSRSFGNWSMAFAGRSAGGRARFGGLAAESGFDPSKLDGDDVFAMLHELVLEEETARPPEADAAGLDVAQLRTEIARLRPDGAAPRASAPADDGNAGGRLPSGGDGTRLPGGASDAALRVLTAALADERRRTSDLRGEIDALQVALASSEDRLDAVRGERDLWAERARVLATALSQDAERIRKESRRSDAASGRARPDDILAA